MHSFLCDIRQKERLSVPLVIHGTGGIGKTQLVREFVFAHAAEFSSIIWIDGRNPHNVRNSFVGLMQGLLDCYIGKSRATPPPYLRIARYLGISGLVDEDGQIAADAANLDRITCACLRWLEREGNTRYLLIFDNVDDLETFQISDFFPKRAPRSIIVTSRRPECSRLGEGWRVEIMKMREGIDLLSKSYGRTIKDNDNGMAFRLFLYRC
jgi:NB-ARC domain